jgi:NAD(P)-dependent dehydrogenase (short-subunit alcohol dehydrogenase family)
MPLQGARVVVVGGSSGIGLAAAQQARQAGAEVTIVGRSPDRLAQAQQVLGEVRTIAADITDATAIGQVFEGLDRVDHVLVSAGTLRPGALVNNDLATLRQIVDERLWGVTHVVRHAAPLMTHGSITLTSGGMSTRPRPGSAMLTAMLAAVEALAPALALELAPVRVNAVTPGLIDTPLLDAAYGAERDNLVRNRAAILPGKRVGTAAEVAQVILLLMTNAYMTGEVVRIDGGSRFL